MKNLILGLLLSVAPFITQAQSQFDRFEDIDGVSSVIVNQKAFELMSKIGAETDEEYLDLIKNIKTLKVFATEDPNVAKQMKAEADRYLKSGKLEELMRVKNKDDNVKIYVKEGDNENFVKELFMFVNNASGGDHETVIISLTGNIDLRQVSKLTDKMDLPGGDELKKVK
ncbi:MAG: DUF4252 domain-containing protein [Flavobacteriia bacterium]|nr:MAG: DUF4252 domain-containing protein [Flavobacteriia bacterium]